MAEVEGARRGLIHHVELWVPDLARAERSWGWLLTQIGYAPYQHWTDGRSWRLDNAYVLVERSPDAVGDRHERRRPGLNHLAFWAGTPADLADLVAAAPAHGWALLFADRHPFAGGPGHQAAYLEDTDGYEVELVADARSAPRGPTPAAWPGASSNSPSTSSGADRRATTWTTHQTSARCTGQRSSRGGGRRAAVPRPPTGG